MQNAAVWENIFKNHPWGKYPGEELIRFVARNFYGKAAKVLEIGCGPGANLWFMAREGVTVYGIDYAETAISQARQRLNQECPGWTGELLAGDIGDLPFESGFFDGVIDNEACSCNSFDKSVKIYNEAARVLKPGGKIFVRTFAVDSWGYNTGEKIEENTWLASEGPLAGKGASRFTDMSDIPVLLQSFQVDNIDFLHRSLDNQKHIIKEWVISATKR